jgi:hypothetical protein
LEFRTFLERAGWPEERINSEVKKAEEAARSGLPYQDPVPYFLQMAAMEAANEVTVPFSRQGILTREINRIQPFFGPAVAGLSKAIRNWRTNTKAAGLAMAGYLGIKLLHWLTFHDEDWYKELSPSDRYSNLVVPIQGLGLRRLPGARDFEVPVGGAMTYFLDSATENRPDLPGLLRQSLGAISPPVPLTPAGDVTQQILRNKDWTGKPIVPRRDESLSDWEKFRQYQGPYAAQQLTGGRGEVSLRGSGLIPFSEVRNARRSLDEFYERLHSLESERIIAQRAGRKFEQEAEYKQLKSVQGKLNTLRRAKTSEWEQKQVELARQALLRQAR